MYNNEVRLQQAGALSLFQEQTESAGGIVNTDLQEKYRQSQGRATKVPVLNKRNVVVRTNRPLTIPAAGSASGFVTLTSVTMASGFNWNPAEFINNDIGLQEYYNHEYMQIISAFIDTAEAYAAAHLEANKTQVATAIGQNIAFTSDVVTETLPLGSKQEDSKILFALRPIMNSNRHYIGASNTSIVGNYGLQSLLEYQASFAGYNSENKTIAWQGKTFGFSDSVANAGINFATGFAVAPNSLGVVSRVERDALLGTNIGNTTKWGSEIMPGLNMPVSIYETHKAVNISSQYAGVSDLTRTGEMAVDFSIDLAFISSHVSDRSAIASPIYKFQTGIATS